MTTRIPRLWQPGNPQVRVFLPDFWMKCLELPKCGRSQLPKNAAMFEVDLRMSRHDVRQYLEKIYKLPVRDVRTRVVMGEIKSHVPDRRARRALWKEEDRKVAYVYFKKGTNIEIPELFGQKDELDEQMEKMQEMIEEDPSRHNAKYLNRERGDVGKFFGI